MEKMFFYVELQRNQWRYRRRDNLQTRIWRENDSDTANYKKEEYGLWKRNNTFSYFFIHAKEWMHSQTYTTPLAWLHNNISWNEVVGWETKEAHKRQDVEACIYRWGWAKLMMHSRPINKQIWTSIVIMIVDNTRKGEMIYFRNIKDSQNFKKQKR